MRRIRLIVFVILLTIAVPASAAEPYEHPYPQALQISVQTEIWHSETHGNVPVDLPVTVLDSVNANLRTASEALFSQADPYADCRIDMMATYRVSGEAWAGFLLTSRAVETARSDSDTFTTENTAALYLNVQTYNMETGAALTLSDVFAQDSPAWAMIADAAREMLYSFYPGEARDEKTLSRITAPEALMECAFLPGAGRLMVPFSLQRILPTHPQIVYLCLPYPDYRPMMLPEAMAQTDNTARPMIALTFDDGPLRVYTQRVLSALARHGASATFFSVGQMIIKQPDLLRREMDYMSTPAAHSMKHDNAWEQTTEELLAEYDTQMQLFQDVTGLTVTMLRPPGGDVKTYVTRQIGWPLIRWSREANDIEYTKDYLVIRRVLSASQNGDIMLMHDVKKATVEALPEILEALEARGFMFATVEELLYLNGIVPQPNVSYYDGLGIKTYPQQ